MTEDDVIDLLSVITAYDKRNTGASEINAWAEAARRGRWTLHEAVEAVHEHFASSTEYLMPGHVNQRLRAARSQPPRSTALPQATPQVAEDDHVRRVAQWLADRLSAERQSRPADDRRALAVPCPRCRAGPNESCVQTVSATGRRRAGNLPSEVPHIQRRAAARTQE